MRTEPTTSPAGSIDSFARRWWYHVFLLVMLAVHVLAPIGLATSVGLGILRFSWVAVLAVGVVCARRNRIELGLAAALLLVSTGSGLAGDSGIGASHLVSIAARLAFFLLIAALILRELAGHAVVTLGTISGAFVAYLLLAEAFVASYDLVDSTTDHATLSGVRNAVEIAGLEEPARRQLDFERRLDLTYFSLVTMTTLGYGDITPRDPRTRSLATLQALIGQAYLAVLIARLVSLYRSPRAPAS